MNAPSLPRYPLQLQHQLNWFALKNKSRSDLQTTTATPVRKVRRWAEKVGVYNGRLCAFKMKCESIPRLHASKPLRSGPSPRSFFLILGTESYRSRRLCQIRCTTRMRVAKARDVEGNELHATCKIVVYTHYMRYGVSIRRSVYHGYTGALRQRYGRSPEKSMMPNLVLCLRSRSFLSHAECMRSVCGAPKLKTITHTLTSPLYRPSGAVVVLRLFLVRRCAQTPWRQTSRSH